MPHDLDYLKVEAVSNGKVARLAQTQPMRKRHVFAFTRGEHNWANRLAIEFVFILEDNAGDHFLGADHSSVSACCQDTRHQICE
jgi:hypothetical protein